MYVFTMPSKQSALDRYRYLSLVVMTFMLGIVTPPILDRFRQIQK